MPGVDHNVVAEMDKGRERGARRASSSAPPLSRTTDQGRGQGAGAVAVGVEDEGGGTVESGGRAEGADLDLQVADEAEPGVLGDGLPHRGEEQVGGAGDATADD